MTNGTQSITRILRQSDVVIPLDEVIAKLESVITPAELEAFIATVVAGQRANVRAGDLITAEFMNGVLARILGLETRVARIEGVGRVEIYEPNPSRQLHVGSALKIEGRNFGELADNIVYLDGRIRIDEFKAGDDTTLVIEKIPEIPDVPVGGRLVSLLVTNKNGNAVTSFELLPSAVTKPTGTINVKLDKVPDVQKIEAGKTYVYTYRITAATIVGETYDLIPSVDLGWDTKVVDEAGNQVVPAEIFIPRPESPTVPIRDDVHIEVAVPQGAQDGTTARLTLFVISQANPNGLRGEPDQEKEIVVEGGPGEPDPLPVILSAVEYPGRRFPDDPNDPDPKVVVEEAGKVVGIVFRVVEIPQPGQYLFEDPTFAPNPANRWSGRVVGAKQRYLGGQQQEFKIKVERTSNAADTTMNIRFQYVGDPTIRGDKAQDIIVSIPN